MTVKVSKTFKEGMYYTNGYKKNVSYATFSENSMHKAWADTGKQLNRALKEYGEQYSKEKETSK